MKNNTKKKQNKKQFTKEQFMKFLSTIFAIFTLMFVIGTVQTQAQDCTDSAGMPIECPEGQTTDDAGNPCDDTDEDGVCDNDEPEGCVGQANEDGQGCDNGNTPTMVDPAVEMLVFDLKESLRELIESGHELSDSLRLILERLDRWNREINECEFNRQTEEVSFPFTIIKPVFDAVQEDCQDDSTADGDFDADGTVDASDFIVWHINPSATDGNDFFMFEYRIPGTDRLIAILFEPEPIEPRARKIFIGELSLTKPDHEIGGEPED